MEEEQRKLGKVIDCFPIRNYGIKRVLWLCIGTLLIIISLAFGIMRLVEIWKTIEIHGRAVLLNRIPLQMLILGIVFSIGVGTVLFTRIHWNDRIKIYDNGMVKQMGSRSQSWLWSQTEQLDNRITYIKFAGNAVAVRVTIDLHGQKQNHFTLKNHYTRMDDLIQLIRQHVLPILYSKAHHKLIRGDTIHFHEQLQVNTNGVEIKEHIHPWHELNRPSIHNGLVTISIASSQQKVFKSNVNQIENLDVLIHLFETHQPKRI